MPITVSGSKYSSTIQSVGTFTIAVPSTTTFSSADFSYKQRIVALHDAATNVLKGIAYVRKYNNGQSLELETQFYQPWDGATVEQAVGDKVNISKNFADVATTGLAVSYNTVSISDSLTFGSNTNQADTCFYDEDYLIQFGVGAPSTSSFPINFTSGVIVFGHLQDYASESITGDVNWTWAGPRGNCTWNASGTHLNLIHYGGGVRTTRDVYSQLIGANPSPASILLHKFFYDSSILANATFPVPSKAILRNCIGYGQDANILLRWKNGTIEGGYYKMAAITTYYSVFGDDAAGTFAIAAPASKRLVIGGVGANSNTSGTSLWRCGAPTNAQIINFTNVISPVRSATNIGADTPLSVMNYYYSDSITNIVSGSQAALWRTSDSVVISNDANTGTVWSPLVLHDKWAGKTRQAGYPITQWRYRIRKYGYSEVASQINASTYPLGNFSSDNVAFSGSVIQVPDTRQTGTAAAAAALTGISLNLTAMTAALSSSRSIQDLNNYIAYQLTQDLVKDNFISYAGTALDVGTLAISGLEYLNTTAAFDKIITTGSVTAGGAFSSLSLQANISQSTPTNLIGVTLVGNLSYNSATNATVTLTNCEITGSVLNSGAGTVTVRLAGGTTIGTVGSNVATQLVTALTLTNLTAGSAIYVADANGNQVAYVASSGTSYSLDTTGMGALSWKVGRYGYLAQSGSHNAATTSTTAAISLAVDAFITQADPTIVAAYSALSNPDRIYDFGAYFETTNAGIPISRVTTKASTQVSLGSYPLILNASGAAWGLASGTLTLNISTSFVPGVTMTGGLVTTGAITLNAQATAAGSWGSISGGSIALAGGINYQPLVAITAISGLPSSGAISAGGSIDFGSSSTYAPAGNFTASNTTFAGTFNVNTSTSRTFTATNIIGNQFRVNATGTAAVKIIKAGTTATSAFIAGTNVTVRQNITIATLDNIPLSTYIVKNGSTVLGWTVLDSARVVEAADSDTFSIYAAAYGYKPKIISAVGSDATGFIVSLTPEVNVDTTLPTSTRNTIAATFTAATDAQSRLALSISGDLRAYTPAEVLNGVHYYTVTQGNVIAASALAVGTTSGFDLMSGGIIIGSPGFYGKVADSVTTTTDLGILVPIAINVLSSVYTLDPTYTPVRKNSSGLILQYAPWTKQAADISALDKADIRDGLALESTLALKADQATVAAIPTSAQNAAAVRTELATELGRIDAAVSTRLATTAYTAPSAAPTSAQNAAAVRSELATELARIDAATSSRLAASSYTAPTTPPTSAEVAAAVRTELTTELARIDAAVTSRLAAAAYTAPGTAPTSAQNAAAVRTELAAELARIDAAVSSRLAASGYTAPGPVPTSAQNAAAVRTELALELARLDAAVSSRLAAASYTAPGTAPTSAEVAAAVRTELAAELARLDVASSTRLAASAYTPPDNASITAIKNNTGLIPALF